MTSQKSWQCPPPRHEIWGASHPPAPPSPTSYMPVARKSHLGAVNCWLLPLPTSWGWIKTTDEVYEPYIVDSITRNVKSVL